MSLFGIDASNYLNPSTDILFSKKRHEFHQACMFALGEILQQFPLCIHAIWSSNRSRRYSVRLLPTVYEDARALIQQCEGLSDLASQCVKICSSYRFPQLGKPVFSEPESVFAFYPSRLGFDQHTQHYLILQALYYKARVSAKAPYSIPKIIQKLYKINRMSSQEIGRNYSSLKYKAKTNNTDDNSSFAKSLFYKTLLADIPKPKNIYEFILSAGLLSTLPNHNPFLQLANSSESLVEDYSESLIGDDLESPIEDNSKAQMEDNYVGINIDSGLPKDFNHKLFFKHFFLQSLNFAEQDVEFKSLSSYIVKRISNANLINYLFHLIRKEHQRKEAQKYKIGNIFISNQSSIANIIYPIANHPLPFFRLRLLNFIYESDTKDFDIVDKNFDNIRASILHHTYFYLPFISRLFSLFLRIKMKDNPKFLTHYYLHENLCPLFSGNDATPIYDFPSYYEKKNKTSFKKKFYEELVNVPDEDNMSLEEQFDYHLALEAKYDKYLKKSYNYSLLYGKLQYYIYKLLYEEICSFHSFDFVEHSPSNVLFNENFYKDSFSIISTFFPRSADGSEKLLEKLLKMYPLFSSYD